MDMVKFRELVIKANKYIHEQKIEDAISLYTEAIETHLASAYLFNNRSMLYALVNRLDEAIKNSNSAIKLDEKSPTGYIRKGIAFELKMDYSEAIKIYNKALKCFPLDKNIAQDIKTKVNVLSAVSTPKSLCQETFLRRLVFTIKIY